MILNFDALFLFSPLIINLGDMASNVLRDIFSFLESSNILKKQFQFLFKKIPGQEIQHPIRNPESKRNKLFIQFNQNPKLSIN